MTDKIIRNEKLRGPEYSVLYDIPSEDIVRKFETVRTAHKRLLSAITANWTLKSGVEHNELVFLHNFVKQIGGGNIANLGCFQGSSAAAMAYALRDSEFGPGCSGKIYTVDTFETMRTYGQQGTHEASKQRFQRLQLEDLIEICVGTTNEWAEHFEPDFFSLVFIDADHRLEAVRADVRNWGPLVRPGGYLLFHDCHLNTVDTAIGELDKELWEQVAHWSLIKAFQKKG